MVRWQVNCWAREYIEGTGGPVIDIRSISGENPDNLKLIEEK